MFVFRPLFERVYARVSYLMLSAMASRVFDYFVRYATMPAQCGYYFPYVSRSAVTRHACARWFNAEVRKSARDMLIFMPPFAARVLAQAHEPLRHVYLMQARRCCLR